MIISLVESLTIYTKLFTLSGEALNELKQYQDLLFEAINYRWAQMLEGFNHSPRICKKVRVIDENIQRKPLTKFSEYLSQENQEGICFICDKPIVSEAPSIDHVLPWSYLYSDDIWNLVYTHQSCNSSKSNKIPNEDTIIKLEERNRRLLSVLVNSFYKAQKLTLELQHAVEKDLVRKFWISCKG